MLQLKCAHAHRVPCLFFQQARWSAYPVDFSKCCGNSPSNTQFSLGSSDVFHNLFKQLFRYHRETCYFRKGKRIPALDTSSQLSEATWGCPWPQDPSIPLRWPRGRIDAWSLHHIRCCCVYCSFIYISRNSTSLHVLQAVMTWDASNRLCFAC